MKTIETYLPVFKGFYGSHWDDVDFYGEDEVYNIPKDLCFDDFVDWDQYHLAIAKGYCDYIEDELNDFVSMIKFEELISPRFYNYTNDSINVEIDLYQTKIDAYLKENALQFAKYLKDNYTSYDGFISSYSIDANDWSDWSDDKHKAGSVLQFICENEGVEEPYYFDDMHISFFYTEELNEYIID